tara:strand:+ start:889 stop:1938 length:1050 start_codon:yes stop_codon:yes gene_type:complete
MKTISLLNKDWGQFKLSSIFEIENCKCSKVSSLQKGDFPYVGATNRNNGVLHFVKPEPKLITKGNCIAFICDGEGSVGYSIYKSENFIGSTTVKVGRSEKLNKYNGAFITTIADTVRSKYNFGFKRNEKHLKNETLMLPMDEKGNPDFEFMETFMKLKEQEKLNEFEDFISKKIKNLKKTKKVESLEQKEWGEFFIADVTDILSGRDIYATDRIKGVTPYISSTANNNGIGAFVGNENPTLESECLSVNRNGSVGYSFYHSYPALFSNDCRKLRLKNPSKHIGIFISQQITRQRGKYGYGYKMGTARLKRQKIMLPINDQNEPDYVFMENYMKRLEYKKLTDYLKKKMN